MQVPFSFYFPSLVDLLGFGALLLTALAFLLTGALLGGVRRLPESDLVTGWGAVTAVFTAYGVLLSLPLGYLVAPVFAIGLIGVIVWRREHWNAAANAGRVTLLGLPLLLVVAPMVPSQWDEFSQWLWSARYLFDVGRFPGLGLPASFESFPAYPKAMALPMHIVSELAGHFVESSGALFNVLVMLSVVLLVARIMALASGGDTQPPPRLASSALAMAFLFTIAFPPFVVPKITLTAYAEVGTASSVAFGAILGWRTLGALGASDFGRAKALALQLGLATTVLVSLKQANLVLAVLVFLGIGIAGLRTPGIDIARLSALLLRAAVLPVLVFGLWRYHVTATPQVEKAIMPFSQWAFDIIPSMLKTVAGIVLRKSVYFAAMLGIAGMAIRGLIRWRDPFDGLAIITATVFIGYNVFLFFIYIASFGGYEGSHALSYWRYNMHVGALGAATWAYILARLWHDQGWRLNARAWRWGAIAAALLIPLLLIRDLRFDIRAPKVYVRAISPEIRQLVPEGARFAIVDPLDAGFYPKLMRYLLYPHATVEMVSVYDPPADALRQALASADVSHAWIHTETEAVRAVFGLPLPDGASYLLEKTEGGWKQLGAWPYPGYRLPRDVPD